MLQEIEVSGIQVADVVFSYLERTLTLPVSKVDWRAMGARRSWQCICQSFAVCPFQVLRKDWEISDIDQPETPLFPTADGRFCTKDEVVSTLRKAAMLAGQEVQDMAGGWLISGHAFRITGARVLASLGLDAITIQLLGRWGSDAMLSAAIVSGRSTALQPG